MITAKEAVALFDHAGKEVDDYLKYTVEPKVVKAAETGNRNVTIFLGSVAVSCNNLYGIVDKITIAAKAKLTELGYIADIYTYGEAYVPKGLSNDDGRGPQHKNYGLHIKW